MGYTHYWRIKKTLGKVSNGKELFKMAVEATVDCIKNVPDELPTLDWSYNEKLDKWESREGNPVPFKLCGWDGTGEPVFTGTKVSFNGDASTGNDHESCIIELDGKESFNFCKTARKPYDVAVCIALICFHHYFGDCFTYSSDGNIEEGEEGWKLAKEITSDYFKNWVSTIGVWVNG